MTAAATHFCERVYAGLQHQGAGAALVIAISGGPDSVALTRAAAQLRTAGQIGRVVLAHFNHQLRGAASNADEHFVREFHKRLTSFETPEIGLHCGRADVLSARRTGRRNVEAIARRLRYQWLAEVAIAEKAEVIVTGHTADDQAETLLHHILRGTGLRGLRGIARCRLLQRPVRLVRPVLDLGRQEILDYLASIGQSYCVDATNYDPRQTRARIRHELILKLQAASNGQAVRILCRTARTAALHYDLQVSLAQQLIRTAGLPRAGLLHVFDRQLLAKAPAPVLREALRLIWRRGNWPQRAMTAAHWNNLAGVVVGNLPTTVFPGGISARVRGNIAQIGPESRGIRTVPLERHAWT